MSNPLLSKVKLPGRVFQLPSKGLFYDPGILAETVKDGEVHVQPMSALAELKMRSADLLFSSKIIREICMECIPEILKPEALVSRDVDGLFLFLLAATYGNEKTIRAIHNCEKAEWHDYGVDLEGIISNPRNQPLDSVDLLYQTRLDDGKTVLLKPVTFTDSVELLNFRQQMDKRVTDGLEIPAHESVELVVRDLLAVIRGVEVGEGEQKVRVMDRKHIEEWIRTLSKKQMDQITTASYKSAEWGFEFKTKLVCKDCGKSYDYDLDLNPVSFFSG